jgi:adenine-specific DNA-methyltransferase
MMPLGSDVAEGVSDYLLWYAKDRKAIKSRPLFLEKPAEGDSTWSHAMLRNGERVRLSKEEIQNHSLLPAGARVYQPISLLPAQYRPNQDFVFEFEGRQWNPPKKNSWKTDLSGMSRLKLANRLHPSGSSLRYILYHADYPVGRVTNLWADSSGATQQVYVVQTSTDVVKRCILMTTDPGDLVIDPTCGSGTTAYVAEQWGRRWITIDTSRVALALARARIMGARYPYYLLSDSREGQKKESEVRRTEPSVAPTHNDIRQGFVYERASHITLGSIANNVEVDVIWERFQDKLDTLRKELKAALGKSWEEWDIPRDGEPDWPAEAKKLHTRWWEHRMDRQNEIDASIAAKADFEYLYDKPYEDNKTVRVAGPFTVESLSPHRVLGVDEHDELIDSLADARMGLGAKQDFAVMILEALQRSGVQQAHKEDKITFVSLTPWPGSLVCAEGRYIEGEDVSGNEKRAAIFIGPEFGTVSRPDLVVAAREAADADFDVLIACAFNYEAHASELKKLGRVPILKARMNADLHMADDLKNTGKGNLFVIFGEPDLEVLPAEGEQIQVKVKGVDVFDPSTGDVRSDAADGIACWFIDTDYNEESFFVRHAYFLGAPSVTTCVRQGDPLRLM